MKALSMDQIWDRIVLIDSGCMQFTGTGLTTHGYASVGYDNKSWEAHRLLWRYLFGPLNKELQLDHLCRNRWCVNIAHLEPVTRRENIIRGISPAGMHFRAIHCPQGHLYTADNTAMTNGGKSRRCKTCHKLKYKRVGKILKQHCKQGHLYDESNTYYRPNGWRDCRECMRQRTRKWRGGKSMFN
jgi:hypothetical protein